jgi:fructose-1,6-bisphosphatase/inositol monophosphatase family enzyme
VKKTVAGALALARGILEKRGEQARAEVRDGRTTDISTIGDRVVSDALVDYFADSDIPGVVLSEESGIVKLCSEPRYTIAIDDIDGTDNFFRGEGILPYCTIVTILEGTDPTFSSSLCAGVIEHRSGTV